MLLRDVTRGSDDELILESSESDCIEGSQYAEENGRGRRGGGPWGLQGLKASSLQRPPRGLVPFDGEGLKSGGQYANHTWSV